jgi:hypothetical protein
MWISTKRTSLIISKYFNGVRKVRGNGEKIERIVEENDSIENQDSAISRTKSMVMRTLASEIEDFDWVAQR